MKTVKEKQNFQIIPTGTDEEMSLPAASLRYVFDAKAIGEKGTVVVCQNKEGELVSYTTDKKLIALKNALSKDFNMNFAAASKFKDPENDADLEQDTYPVHIVASTVENHQTTYSAFDDSADAPAGHDQGYIVTFKSVGAADLPEDGYTESGFPFIQVLYITHLKEELGTSKKATQRRAMNGMQPQVV